MVRVLAPSGGGTAASAKAASAAVAATQNAPAGSNPSATSMSPAVDEPHSNLPFDPRMMRRQFWKGAKNVTAGVITNDVAPLAGAGGAEPPVYGGGVSSKPFYCFSLFNPAEIDANYGFDPSGSGMLPQYMLNPQIGNGGGVLTQTVNFNLLFDRTYEVWNGPQVLPPSANYGFGQDWVGRPKSGGPYRFGVLWDVWALERLCGIFRQADGIPPSGPPTIQLLHIITGGVTVANTTTDTSQSGWTHINVVPTPSSLDFWAWMTQFSVQYTRFDTNMVPTRCAVSLGFQLTYAEPDATSNPDGQNPSPTG